MWKLNAASGGLGSFMARTIRQSDRPAVGEPVRNDPVAKKEGALATHENFCPTQTP